MIGNQKFDKARLPMTFYAHILQFIERDACDGRCAVLFEAVEKEEVQMFVTGELPKKLSNAAENMENFQALWENYQQGGLASPAFLEEKAFYLGKAGNAQIALRFHSFAKAKSIAKAKNDWWEITVKDTPASKEMDGCLLKITGYERAEEEFAFTLRPASTEENERLYHLYTQFPEPKPVEGRDSKNAIRANTAYSAVEVCYVGAGLCCALKGVLGSTVGYFDMGLEHFISEALLIMNDPNYRVMNREKARIESEVKNSAQSTRSLGVVISHWHMDHVEILNDLADAYIKHGRYARFWQTAQFFYPGIIQAGGWAVTYYANFRAAVRQANNQNRVKEIYHSADQNIPIFQSQNMNIYKCDRNDAHLANINHHDHGVWAGMTLTNGNTVFLAGDCNYDTIGVGNVNSAMLTNQGQGYEYLVASHHGGVYTHTRAQNKAQYIPTPSQPGQSEAFYSANGSAYGHPDPAAVADYTNQGWVAKYTHTLPLRRRNRWVIR